MKQGGQNSSVNLKNSFNIVGIFPILKREN